MSTRRSTRRRLQQRFQSSRWAAFPLALAGFAPAALGGQAAPAGSVDYVRSVQFDFEVPERMAAFRDRLAAQNTASMVLRFDGARSIMMPDPDAEAAAPRGGARDSDRMDRRALGMALRLRMGSASRSDQEDVVQAYVDFGSGAITETREFMGRTFLISGDRPAFAWKLGTEQREFLGYMVQQATAVHDGSEIEAWFTPQIPVQAGPGQYGGLPGLILVLTVDGGDLLYSATEVNLDGPGDVAITPPTDGEMVTREEYEALVAEKLEEIRATRGAGNRRRPFDGGLR
ncbi:GLPGLI family protein [Candidatus Palauibacter polyketidifaciens]|uniref:GLPGLI family protein n=1 Tax=Candidatus Palauibacter polyketidifaciens TaxID=3056740 RepID=UPI00139DE549|nr:GLPGLI family protein [Candidatus Palauibacter polyketidifaciens]MDE2720467.1 GLPGLI family protein [Candidatus Palauibacter polyketidifaciens]MYE35597.1 GLPGLI family protein [Gemmatimonadales bacterium]